MSALCIEVRSSQLPWREMQLSRDISKGKGILGIFTPIHGAAHYWKSLATLPGMAGTWDAVALRFGEA